MLTFFQIKGDIPDIRPDVVFKAFGWPIPNSGLQITLILILISLFCYFVIRKFTLTPTTKIQHAIEALYDGMMVFAEQIIGSKSKAREVAPVILSLFIFVALANLINFIPGLNSFTWNGVSLFRTPTSDFNTTFSMALALILFIQFAAIKKTGIFSYIGKFIQIKQLILAFKEGVGAGFTALIEFFVGLLDIVSECAKVFSLSLRLFGNIYAGEVLLVMIFGALAIGLPSVWMSLSLFFGIIQAIVFGSLAAAYYASSIPDEEVAVGE